MAGHRQTAILSVVASGSRLTYQWYQGFSGDTSTPVGSDSDTFTTPALMVGIIRSRTALLIENAMLRQQLYFFADI